MRSFLVYKGKLLVSAAGVKVIGFGIAVGGIATCRPDLATKEEPFSVLALRPDYKRGYL